MIWPHVRCSMLDVRCSKFDVGRSTIQRAPHPQPSLFRHVQVNLRRFHAAMSQQLLHCTDVGPRLEQVRGKTVPQHVRTYTLVNARAPRRLRHCFLERILHDMMPTCLATPGIGAELARWKYPLPDPLTLGARVLASQRLRQPDRSMPGRPVRLMEPFHPRHMLPQIRLDLFG